MCCTQKTYRNQQKNRKAVLERYLTIWRAMQNQKENLLRKRKAGLEVWLYSFWRKGNHQRQKQQRRKNSLNQNPRKNRRMKQRNLRKNPKTNRGNAGFTDEERACFSKVLENGFIDTFRYFYPEQTGIYSWWSYRFQARAKNVGWRIDYFVVSQCLQDRLTDAKIHTEVPGSDHCPIELDIQ